MKIALFANQVPFSHGGAEHHISGLYGAFKDYGYDIELIRFPFKFSSISHIQNLMHHCGELDANQFDGHSIDCAISLQFPSWGIRHDNHRIWVMHQHRAVYDLYDENQKSLTLKAFKKNVESYDNDCFKKAKKVFANSVNVAKRLERYNNVRAMPIYHPPPSAKLFYAADSLDYIFYPSRLESLKRQDLLIEAAAKLKSPVKILIGGVSGEFFRFDTLIPNNRLDERVEIIGRFSEKEKYALYARSLAVFFGPFDEDYGYITLEAMLSSKPVITCVDSGGALEFVKHQETGLVVESNAEAVAEAIDQLYFDKQKAVEMGKAGKAHFDACDITWHSVCEKLLDDY